MPRIPTQPGLISTDVSFPVDTSAGSGIAEQAVGNFGERLANAGNFLFEKVAESEKRNQVADAQASDREWAQQTQADLIKQYPNGIVVDPMPAGQVGPPKPSRNELGDVQTITDKFEQAWTDRVNERKSSFLTKDAADVYGQDARNYFDTQQGHLQHQEMILRADSAIGSIDDYTKQVSNRLVSTPSLDVQYQEMNALSARVKAEVDAGNISPQKGKEIVDQAQTQWSNQSMKAAINDLAYKYQSTHMTDKQKNQLAQNLKDILDNKDQFSQTRRDHNLPTLGDTIDPNAKQSLTKEIDNLLGQAQTVSAADTALQLENIRAMLSMGRGSSKDIQLGAQIVANSGMDDYHKKDAMIKLSAAKAMGDLASSPSFYYASPEDKKKAADRIGSSLETKVNGFPVGYSESKAIRDQIDVFASGRIQQQQNNAADYELNAPFLTDSKKIRINGFNIMDQSSLQKDNGEWFKSMTQIEKNYMSSFPNSPNGMVLLPTTEISNIVAQIKNPQTASSEVVASHLSLIQQKSGRFFPVIVDNLIDKGGLQEKYRNLSILNDPFGTKGSAPDPLGATSMIDALRSNVTKDYQTIKDVAGTDESNLKSQISSKFGRYFNAFANESAGDAIRSEKIQSLHDFAVSSTRILVQQGMSVPEALDMIKKVQFDNKIKMIPLKTGAGVNYDLLFPPQLNNLPVTQDQLDSVESNVAKIFTPDTFKNAIITPDGGRTWLNDYAPEILAKDSRMIRNHDGTGVNVQYIPRGSGSHPMNVFVPDKNGTPVPMSIPYDRLIVPGVKKELFINPDKFLYNQNNLRAVQPGG